MKPTDSQLHLYSLRFDLHDSIFRTAATDAHATGAGTSACQHACSCQVIVHNVFKVVARFVDVQPAALCSPLGS